MNRLLLSSILATGLAFGASGVFAADQYGGPDNVDQQAESYQQNTSADNMRPEGGEYTVQSGDTLATIAEEQLGSQDRWQEIAMANDLENPDRIFEGQKLTIPPAEGANDQALNKESAQQEDAAEISASTSEDSSGDMTDSERARDSQPMNEEQELKGEITEIDAESDSFSLKDEQGMTHLFTKLEDEDILDEVSVGDFVKVEIENGTVVSLEKVDRSA